MLELLTGKSLGSVGGYLPMMAIGYFVFNLHTTPYQSQQHERGWRHVGNSRVGLRPSSQFIGPDDEKITLSGSLYPEITGGRVSLDMLVKLADTGKAYPVIEGTGIMHGLFVIESLSETKTEFFSDGSARKIDFTVSLKRVDEADRGLLGVLSVGDLDLGSSLGSQVTGMLGGIL